jgi:asparagine synthase (glutamine-hydrolysing)
VAALAARSGPVTTFTLRPPGAGFDEGGAAAATAAAVGATHREVVVTSSELDRAFEDALERIDEPIGDSSVVAVLLLAAAAAREVKVVLTGEGADELFGGYPTYVGARLADAASRFSVSSLRRVASLVRPRGFQNVGARWLVARLLEGAAAPPLERHLAWLGGVLPVEQPSLWRRDALPPIVGEGALLAPVEAAAAGVPRDDAVEACLRADLLLHLSGVLLPKVDRATMLCGLEARAPFLERSLVERAAAVPAAWKVRGLSTKVVLRRALRGTVPGAALRRRKRGFALPVSAALAGRLGDRLERRLSEAALFRDLLDPSVFRALLGEHRRRERDHGRRLWSVLALVEWAERWAGAPRGRSPSGGPALRTAEPAALAP